MYSKSEIIEIIWRQFPIDLNESDLEKLSLKITEQDMIDGMKQACGADLVKMGSKFTLKYN